MTKPAKNSAKRPRRTKKRGPPPETLVIGSDWKLAIGHALNQGTPPKTSPKKKRRSK